MSFIVQITAESGQDMSKMENTNGIVFKIQKYAIHDGPGIRTVVFLKGCPLHCIWCCNPESWNPHREIAHLEQLCMKFGDCLRACMPRAITVNESGKKVVDKTRCTLCGLCVDKCVTNAMQCIGTRMTVEDVIRAVDQDGAFYTESGGGVTLSGGEPTLQFEFSKELLRKFQSKGMHTAIETCGYTKWSNLNELAHFTDLLLYDVKVVDRKKHISFTGVPNDTILSNLEKLTRSGKSVVIRYPLVHPLNDSDVEIDELTRLILKLNSKNRTIREAHIMPYHRLGAYKYSLLGIAPRFDSLKTPSQDEILRIRDRIQRASDIRVKVGG